MEFFKKYIMHIRLFSMIIYSSSKKILQFLFNVNVRPWIQQLKSQFKGMLLNKKVNNKT